MNNFYFEGFECMNVVDVQLSLDIRREKFTVSSLRMLR
jgi:hypothetical protein